MKFLPVLFWCALVANAAEVKISELPETNAPSASAVIPIVDGGANWKVQKANILGTLTNWSKLSTNALLWESVPGTYQTNEFQVPVVYLENLSPGASNLFLFQSQGLDAMKVLPNSGLVLGPYPGPSYPTIGIYRKNIASESGVTFSDIYIQNFSTNDLDNSPQAQLDITLSVDPDFPGAALLVNYATNSVDPGIAGYLSAQVPAQGGLGLTLGSNQKTYARLGPDRRDPFLFQNNVVPYLFNTTVDVPSGNLAEVANHGTNKFTVSWDGISSSVSGFSSLATDAFLTFTSTGITNILGKIGNARFDGTNVTYVVKNNAGTPVYTNAVSVGHAFEQIQAGGAIVVTVGTVIGTVAPQ